MISCLEFANVRVELNRLFQGILSRLSHYSFHKTNNLQNKKKSKHFRLIFFVSTKTNIWTTDSLTSIRIYRNNASGHFKTWLLRATSPLGRCEVRAKLDSSLISPRSYWLNIYESEHCVNLCAIMYVYVYVCDSVL